MAIEKKKELGCAVLALLLLLFLLKSCGGDSEDSGEKPTPDVTATEDVTPAQGLRMPDLTGASYAEAVAMLADSAGVVVIEAAYADETADDIGNVSGTYGDWEVCFQSVEPGQALTGGLDVTLHAVGSGDVCPSSTGTYKDPTNDPSYVDPEPEPEPEAEPEPEPDVGSSGDDESTGSGGGGSDEDYNPGDEGGCPPGGCYNPCPPGGCS